MKNKKADIAITILVIMVIALCTIATLSFYLVNKRQESSGIESVVYLQQVYNLAESVKFSENLGENLYKEYDLEKPSIIEKEFLDGKLKIKYEFG